MKEPIDVSKYLKSLDLTMTTGFVPQLSDDANPIYAFDFKPTSEIELDITFEHSPIFVNDPIFSAALRKSFVKIEQRGRFWFDRAFEGEVHMKDLTINPDGSYSSTFEGMNYRDLTDYSLLARFLRWILRR